MTMPTWREWLFSAKALLAALLALYIALAIPLDNPYWAMASVYVVSHPLSGATRSKALYRALGTLLGAAASVAIIPTFAQQPLMMSLAMSAWIGALLFLSLLDRTPRSYIFMLAAYTVPLISLSEVNHPATLFDVALARSEEILLGIVCASLVNAVVFPSRIAPILGARMDRLLADGREVAARLLASKALDAADQAMLNRLLVDVMGLDGMIVQLSYDSSSHLPARHARDFRARMAMLIPQLVSLGDALQAMRRELPQPLPELAEYLQQVALWIDGSALQVSGRQLQERSRQLEVWLADEHPRQALAIESALRQLRALIDLWQDSIDLRQSFAEGHPERSPVLHYRVEQLVGGPRYYDHGLLAFSAASVALGVFLLCVLWFLSGWEHGYAAVFIAAVASCFFAGQDNPAPFIRSFLVATLISTLAAATYLFALMPNVQDFGSLATLFAVPLLLLGTLAGRPQYAGTVVLLAVQTISTITIQDSYRADFPLFADMALSTASGVVFALIWVRLTRPFGMLWAVQRLAREGWASLAELTEGRRHDFTRVVSRVIDRVSQLLPRIAQLDDGGQAFGDAIQELRICFRLLELQQARPHTEGALEALFGQLGDHFQACAGARRQLPLPAGLALTLDRTLDGLQQQPMRSARQAARALHGLRLALQAPNPPGGNALPLTAGASA